LGLRLKLKNKPGIPNEKRTSRMLRRHKPQPHRALMRAENRWRKAIGSKAKHGTRKPFLASEAL
jgi:hypothetical protein